MSYQAITDIIANQSQGQDFLLSAAVKDSPQQSSVSFADMLASFNKEESRIDSPKQNEYEQVKEPEKLEKAEKTSENQVEKEKSTDNTSEKVAEKTDSKDSENKIDDKNEKSDKLAAKDVKDSQVKENLEASDAVKKTGKDVKDSKKDKKLTEKDFSRLNEIAQKSDAANDGSKLAAAAQKFSNNDEKLSLKVEDENEADFELLNDSSTQLSLNEVSNSGENTTDSFEFDFSGGEEKGKKQFALDKDGKITVEDLRTKAVEETEPAESKKSAIKTSDIKLTNDSTAVMSVELNPNAEADVLSLNTQTAASNGSNFQAMLSNQLTNVAPEFVKAGNLILKDNNQGTINLILHPDDLGNVKIHLSLDGKTLSGHITVATKEALQVFKDNAETLREAFIKSGFDTASFDVAMNNGGSFNQDMGFNGQDDGRNLFAKRVYGDSAGGLSAELDDIFENTVDISNYSVNIVA